MEQNQATKTNKKKSSWLKRLAKVLFWSLLLLILLSGIALYALDNYLSSNERKIFDRLSFLNNGTISFDEASISIYKNFPSATLSLNNVLLHDSLFDQHQKPVLKLAKLNAALSIGQLLQDSVEINAVEFFDGEINLFTDQNGYSNFKSLIKQKENKIQDQKEEDSKNFFEKMNILFDGLDVSLSNINVQVLDEVKTSTIEGLIKRLHTKIDVGKKISGLVDLEVEMKEMTFQKKNGSFLKNSKVAGVFNGAFGKDIIQVEPFDLHINDQQFLFDAYIIRDGTELSRITLKNKKTDYYKTLDLLPKRLQKEILPYKVNGLFDTRTNILGTFKPGNDPIIDIEFLLKQNDLDILNTAFKDAQLKGRFVNRIFQDKRMHKEGKNRLRFDIEKLKAKYKDFDIQTKDAQLTITKKEGLKLNVDANIQGDAAAISDWVNSEQYAFEKGRFNLSANFRGPLQGFNELIIASNAKLNLDGFSVVYKPSNILFPFEKLELTKKAGDTKFEMVNKTFVDGHDLLIGGGLNNLPALVFDLSDERASSEVNIVSKKLSWLDVINLFGENGYLKNDEDVSPRTDKQKKKSMKETISGIHNNFQPRLTIDVDTLQYYSLFQLQNFHTGVHFEGKDTLVLEKTSFDYDIGQIDFSGKLDISGEHRTPFELQLHTKNLNLQKLLPTLNYLNFDILSTITNHPKDLTVDIIHSGVLDDETGLVPNSSTGQITFDSPSKALSGKISYEPDHEDPAKRTGLKMKIELEGDPKDFNDFFKTEQFFFSKGRFYTELEYSGDIGTVGELLNSSKIKFSLVDSEVYYKIANVHFPLSKIDLSLQDGIADFNFFLRSDSLDREILFDGAIENIGELIIGNTQKKVHTNVDISSPKLSWQNFLNVFGPRDTTKVASAKNDNNVQSFKTSVKGILGTFDPDVRVKVDTFIYSKKLILENLYSGIHMNDSSTLIIDRTGFNFHNGTMQMDGEVNLGRKGNIPFVTNFKAKDLDVAGLLESLDYLSIESLQEAEKLKGRITMDFDFKGALTEDAKELLPAYNLGVLDFDLQNVELQGLPVLDTISLKVKNKNRFKNVKFAPITNQITITGQVVEIPLMEIQSTAINFFIEGTFSYDNRTNLWISVPLDNLKYKEQTVAPMKRGYAATRRKVYLEVYAGDDGKEQFKPRISKRKFYKQRGILKQFRKDKKKYRKIRKKLRKAKKGKRF